MKLVAQYQCKSSVDVSSSESDSDFYISSGPPEQNKAHKETKDVESESGKRKTGTARLPTRRPDPNVYNRNALLARENRRKKKAYMESVERELNESRNANRSLLKALKKQFKLSQKLEQECQYLKDILGNFKESKNTKASSPDNRSASPDGSLISTYSSSSYEVSMENNNTFPGMLNFDNGTVAAMQFINEPPASSWTDFIDDLLTDYQPAPAYDDDNSIKLLDKRNSEVTLKPLNIIDEHSYFNKFAEIDFSPNCEWSPSRTPPSQLLQDEDFLFDPCSEYIASL